MIKALLVSSLINTYKKIKTADKDFNGKAVSFIPTAANMGEANIGVIINKMLLKGLGANVEILNISQLTADEIELRLNNSDCIFVNGGNTFYLLQELKRTGADKMIKAQIEKGKLYIGESAGAVIASPDIEYIQFMDDKGKAPLLKDYSSLGITDFYILPHCESRFFKKSVSKIIEEYDNKIELKKINNRQAILLDGIDIKLF